MRLTNGLVFAMAAVVVAVTTVMAQSAPPAPPPPAAATPRADVFEAAGRAGAGLPRLQSLLVSWHGSLVLERYYNGGRAARLANIKSASKSVISALVGIAIDRKLIPGLQQPIASYFPEALAGPQFAAKRGITIEHLLSMRAGLETTSNRNYGRWVLSPNWVRFALAQPLLAPPGEAMQYSTGNTHLLSAILTRATGVSTWQFAQSALAAPLGFTLARWPRDPQGVFFGGNDMLMTPRQMVAFGELYRNRGRVGDKEVISAAWVDASLEPRVQSPFGDRMYGLGWWIRDLAGHRAFYAWGYGGQFIFVVPDLDLVIVTTSSATPGDERRAHRQIVIGLIEEMIVGELAK